MIKVRGPSGKIGYVDEETLEKYKQHYEVIPEESQFEDPQESQGLLSSLAAPFKRTGQRVAGAGESLARLLLNKQAGRIEKAMPGGTQRSQELRETVGAPSRLTENEKYRESLTSPGQIAKDSAAILSYGVPAGTSTKAFGKTLSMPLGKGLLTGGALGGAGYSEKENLAGVAGDALKGAGTSWMIGQAINKIAGKFSGKTPTGAEDDLIEKGAAGDDLLNMSKKKQLGYNIKRETTRPKAGGGVGSYRKENQIIDFLDDLDIKGTPENKRRLGNAIYERDYEAVGKVLSGADLQGVDADDVIDTIKTLVETEGTFYVPGDKTNANLLKRELSLIRKQAKNGKIDAESLHKAIGTLNKQTSGAYNKIAPGGSSTITQVEGVRLDVNTMLHDMIREAAPEQYGDLMSEMSMLHRASPGLKHASLEAFNMYGGRFPLAAQAKIGAMDRVGNFLLKGGGQAADQAVPQVAGQAPQKAGALTEFLKGTTLGGPTAASAVTAATSKSPVVSQLEGVEEFTKSAGEKEREPTNLLGLSKTDLALMSFLDPKSQEKIMEKIIEERVTGDGDEGLSEVSKAVSKAYLALKEGNVSTGMIGGRVPNIAAQLYSGGSQATLDFNVAVQNIYAAIAKARGGTALTNDEKKMLNEYLGQKGDSKQVLETKLRYALENPEMLLLD